ncbi:efflux RND transporter periplasmic adaptor subunit, partial [Singulisphaera rosea]
MKLIPSLDISGHRKWLLASSLVALVVAAGLGHDRRRRVDNSPKSKPVLTKRVVEVEAIRPRLASMARSIEQPGQIDAFERTPLYSKIPGFVDRYHFDIGDRVRKGQVLAELRVPEVVEELHQKDATVLEDEALIVQTRAMLRVSDAKVTQSDATLRYSGASRLKAEATRSWWTLEHKRVSRLVGRGASPQAELEQTDEKLKTADAAVSESVAGVALAEAALVEA